MRCVLLIALPLLMARPALADTVYKCVGADGKITFSDSACQGNAKAAARLEVPAPAPDSTRAARLQAESERLADANAEFNKRYAERTKAEAEQASRDADRRAARQDAERAEAAARQREQDELDRQAAIAVRAARLERCRGRRFRC